MELSSKIYVAGHNGLVGSAIKGVLERKGYNNLIYKTIGELDLTNQSMVEAFFREERPEYVFLAAALVGGIIANNTLRADFIYQNLMIQNNVINASWKYGVKKLLFLGSTCIYPKDAPQPLKEDYLLTSPLEYTNEPYAIAKIAGLKMCESFNIQYKTNFIAVMPTNLYGPGDNYNLQHSHVLPALMRKMHLGKCLENNDWTGIKKDLNRNPVGEVSGKSDPEVILKTLAQHGVGFVKDEKGEFMDCFPDKEGRKAKVGVKIWGTGTPFREFMYSVDMAEACVFVMENVNVNDIVNLQNSLPGHSQYPPHFINIGTQEEVTIKDLANRIKDLVGFRGDIIFDTLKPDGTMRKTTDVTILRGLGYKHKYNLADGLKVTYEYYLKQQA